MPFRADISDDTPAAAPPACEVCGGPVGTGETETIAGPDGSVPPRLCGSRECRRAWLGPRPHERQRALTRATRDVAAAWAAALRAELVVTPSNERPLVAAEPARQERFRAALRERVARAIPLGPAPRSEAPTHEGRRSTEESSGGDTRVQSADGDSHPLVVHACTTCRGFCCTRGGTHAFLDDASLQRAARVHGWSSTADALAAYDARMPATAYDASCVFHGSEGCALPRTMRSDTCNRHLCGGLAVLGRAPFDGALPTATLIVGASWRAPTRAALVTASVATASVADAMPLDQLPTAAA